jgi:hypothetical protein
MVTKITLEQYFNIDPILKAGTVLYDYLNRDYIFMKHGDTGRGVVVNLRENWVVSAYNTKYPCRLSELNEVASAKFHLSNDEPSEIKYLEGGMKIEINDVVYTLVYDITYEQIKDKLGTSNIRVIVEDD